ncbi:hypothetical protein [Microcoleus sp. bin38.metabat.b11b12b14.051]|uniref:hypothetical protein n=1 Tax=Microcoleus sp. bin38.metabat.b11b12b14.051 TaxID=2742709 RepID=UPI0026010D3E|nr:hypothetical protein [Microcoleus sp. bin38.metabat.b11b12b14.051]
MFTSLTETNPASRSFTLNDSSIDRCLYFVVSRILAAVAVILVEFKSDGIEQVSSALQKYASILRKIDKVSRICGRCWDNLAPEHPQLLKWQSLGWRQQRIRFVLCRSR